MPNLHPILVHFTIALFITSVLFDVIGLLTGKESLRSAGWWNLLVAGVFAVPTVITGLAAEATLPHTDEAHQLMQTHKILGLVVLGTLIALVVWRGIKRGTLPAKPVGLFFLAGIIGLIVMITGAYYGGEMVYTHGMGVAPMMEQMMATHHHGGHEHGDSEAVENHEHHDEMSADTAYTCPMHPEVISNEPGKCPECGMTLQIISPDHDHDHGDESDMSEDHHKEDQPSHSDDNHHDGDHHNH